MQRHPPSSATFELGSAEWVALPELGVAAVLARIDTGARTSALHATAIEVYAAAAGPRVRFVVQPVPGRRDIVHACDLPLVARRWVTSSNGARERRCVIATEIAVGGRSWPIEITLTNRARMRHRMLLGRQAILPDMVVLPSAGSRQPTLDPDRDQKAVVEVAPVGMAEVSALPDFAKPLRLGLIGVGPVGPAWQHLANAALARGHLLERLDIRACRLVRTPAGPRIESAGRICAPLGAAVALAEPAMSREMAAFQLAILRQAEAAGAIVLNDAEGLARCNDPMARMQALWAAAVPVLAMALSVGGVVQPETRGEGIASFVVEGKLVLASDTPGRRGKGRRGAERSPTAAEGRLMIRAAAALGLGLARVSVVRLPSGDLVVAEIDASAGLTAPSSRPLSAIVAAAVVRALEARAWARTFLISP